MQDISALDVRLRRAVVLIVYKNFDESLDKQKDIDYEVKRVLKKMKYNAALRIDYFWRQLAVAIDAEGKYTFINADASKMRKLKFIYVTGENLYERDKMHLIYYLVEKVNLEKKKWYIRGKLYEEIEIMKKKSPFVRVSKSDFTEIIERAKTIAEDKKGNETIEQKKRREHLIKHLVDNFDVNQQTWYFKASLMEEIEHIKGGGEEIVLKPSEMERIILLAKKEAMDKITQEKETEEIDEDKNNFEKIGRRIPDETIRILNEDYGVPFNRFKVLLGIPSTTAFNRLKDYQALIKTKQINSKHEKGEV